MEITEDWLWENRSEVFEAYFQEGGVDEPIENMYQAYIAYREKEDFNDTIFFVTPKIEEIENESEWAANALIELKMLIEILQERVDYIKKNIPLCKITMEEYEEDKAYFVRSINKSQNLKELLK